MNTHIINSKVLNFEIINDIVINDKQLQLSEESTQNIIKCRAYLDKRMQEQTEPIYGISTGFGSLCNHSISKDDLETLQKNLVVSHACGTGDEVPTEIVKIMLLLKIHALSLGFSGVQLTTVQRLIEMFNNNVIPIVYQQGSLGASGDLAPLAHLSLPLLNLGEVYYEGHTQPAEIVCKKLKWEPIILKSKEGLALLNGTQFMSAYGVYCLIQAQKLSKWADTIAALSLDAFDGRIEPFNALIHRIRPHKGQIDTADCIRKVLEGSELINQSKSHVQDPYSFRCVPQVHGASKDSISYVTQIFLTEINAVTDNPTVFPDDDLIISAGNFHGQPLAVAFDFLCIALAELGSISERRVYQLISGKRNLPSFLVAEPGLNSGFMIPQYTAASIVSQNKQLCTPASIDTIESSQGQEDHVSMGANAATKALRVVHNIEKILAIELFNATQAMEFRRPLKTSPQLENLLEAYREKVPFVSNDQIMYPLIGASVDFIKTYNF